MLLPTEIHFDVARDGRIASVNIPAHLDATEDMFAQVQDEAEEWISRQLRVKGFDYSLVALRAVHYQFAGRWHSGLEWDDEVKNYADGHRRVVVDHSRDAGSGA